MGYRVLTTAILAVHFGYLAYLLAGGFLAWWWRRTIFLHLAAAVWGFLIVTLQWICPLTYAEDWSRRRAGEAGLTSGFIDRYIAGVLYPERYTGLMQVLAATVVIGSWVGFAVMAGRRRRRRTQPR
jgi:hypothetical protein